MLEKYIILKTINSVNYTYLWMKNESGGAFFAKKLTKFNKNLLDVMYNEVEKLLLVEEYANFPKLVEYDLTTEFLIVYQYIEGTSLLRRKNLDISSSLQLLITLCDLVNILHSLNLVHCDIKSSNIIFNGSNVYLIDFGSAHFIGKVCQYGSLSYCSIDQIDKKQVSYFFDIYAMGIVLYELITNKNPFIVKDKHQLISMKRKGQFLSCSDTIINVPQEIDNIILKATTNDDNLRYKSILELQKDLIMVYNVYYKGV